MGKGATRRYAVSNNRLIQWRENYTLKVLINYLKQNTSIKWYKL